MWLAACGDTGSAGPSGGTSTTTDSTLSSGGTTSTGGTGTGGNTIGTGGGGTGGTGGNTTSAGGSAPTGVCGRRCTMDVECCPGMATGCPGGFPDNYQCLDLDGNGEKTCRLPQCTQDADCNGGGSGVFACKSTSNSSKRCVLPCEVDIDCMSPATCMGVSADGTKYCAMESQPFTCTPEGKECSNFGHCAPSGDKCICTSDDECSDSYRQDCVNVGL